MGRLPSHVIFWFVFEFLIDYLFASKYNYSIEIQMQSETKWNESNCNCIITGRNQMNFYSNLFRPFNTNIDLLACRDIDTWRTSIQFN